MMKIKDAKTLTVGFYDRYSNLLGGKTLDLPNPNVKK